MTLQLSNHVLSFSRKLFLSVVTLFLVFSACFMAFQYHREKEYKIEVLNTRLQDYNDRLHDYLCDTATPDVGLLDRYVKEHAMPELRVTLIRDDGTVMFDNLQQDLRHFENHRNRREIKEAMTYGSGYSINRASESLGGEFFYSARFYPDAGYIIRSALPYDVSLISHLEADVHYVWFTLLVSLALMFLFYRFTHKLGMSITRLQQFALKADRNEPIDTDMPGSFPKNELGEISQHIIQIYKRLHKAKEDLYIEREKLITHLRISHEGLGVFTHRKKEILVNNLFTQYVNFISDKNLASTEEVFSVPELKPVANFITKSLQGGPTDGEERRMSLNIDKNGRIFAIECIIFQDDSFEISINDVTQEEEQARIKKQLTQNIAHELKTPVSSIQGYLETIINNPELPRERMMGFLERSYAQSNRLTHLLRDISALTRMEEAPGMMETETVNLCTIMQNILNEVNMDLEEKQIEARNLLPKELTVQGNASLLYSVFRNLTDNAIAYAGTGITITVRCFREDHRFYYFSFSDTGTGVAPEHLSRLFERFYRVDKGRSRKLGGTGLGLAIVKNAIILHGGNIFAKNNPHGGLEFIFTLSKA